MESKVTLDHTKVLDFETKQIETTFDARDAIIYALGIGYSQDPLKEDDYKFSYELKDDFAVFPTYGSCVHKVDVFEGLISCPGMPQFNAMMLLHGEQRMEFFKPFTPGQKLVSNGKISNISDKGKGALVNFDVSTYEKKDDGSKDLLCVNSISLFIRGLGGFGFKGRPSEAIPKTPTTTPTKVFEQATRPDQAFLYRLSGDYNPLHVDPQMAAMGGFDKPILHGLCSYGIVAKLIAEGYCGNDANKIKVHHARFTSHVFPGETLVVSTWQDGNKISFSAATKERKKEAVVGQIILKDEPKL
mmetsp:Transcript_53117/g.60987  ORF Transcript_53117/g.60987 Transcript_53117/m.60987 type:complete len:301 (-) Transcript_53117:194-1096(-)